MRLLSLLFILTILTPGLSHAQTILEIEEFGVGNVFRPGETIGVRMRITGDVDETTTGVLQWEIENADGDIAEFSRAVSIPARGGQTVVWLYGKLPPTSTAANMLDRDWGFRLFETDEGSRVQEIANARISPSMALTAPRPIEMNQDQILVIGPNSAGLSGYDSIAGMPGNPALNEVTITSVGVRPNQLPDSWQGLSPFSTVVWGGANDATYSPGELDGRRNVENALREWISRGGHLVIILPSNGDPWRLGRNETGLGDILDGLEPEVINGISLASLLPAVSVKPGLRVADKTISVTTFDPEKLPPEWMAQLAITPREVPSEFAQNLPKSLPMVWGIRRHLDLGAIDVVGIDVTDRDLQIQQSPRLPDTATFWRPILGRRATAPDGTTINSLIKEKKVVSTSSVQVNSLGSGLLITTQIGLGGAAAQGILSAMLLFGVYWLVAGPGGFAILRNFKLQRHAWLVFLATSMGFALLAWLGSRVLRENELQVKHVTVLSHIYSPQDDPTIPQVDLASSWFSASLPGYGTVDIRIGNEDDSNENTLEYFSPPPNGSGDRFPNSDRYQVPFESTYNYSVPARATSAEFLARFKGVPNSSEGAWSGTISVDPTNPVKVTRIPEERRISISGTLINSSGVDFDRVQIFQIHSLRTPNSTAPPNGPPIPVLMDELSNYGVFVTLSAPWIAGQSINLNSVLYPKGSRLERQQGEDSLGFGIRRAYVNPYNRSMGITLGDLASLGTNDQVNYLQMLGVFKALPPPIWLRATSNAMSADTVRFNRLLGRDIDRSRFFTESSLMIVAFANEVPSPVPMTIDGRIPSSSGRVMLQWIHPLRSADVMTDVRQLAQGPRWRTFNPPEEASTPRE